MILEEIARAQMQDINALKGIETLLLQMQGDDWASAFRQMRARTAQIDHLGDARFSNRLCNRFTESLLFGAE